MHFKDYTQPNMLIFNVINNDNTDSGDGFSSHTAPMYIQRGICNMSVQ